MPKDNDTDCVYTVIFTWDDEAGVWVATSPDIIGLVLEPASLDALRARVEAAVPELLELNHQKPAYGYTSKYRLLEPCTKAEDEKNSDPYTYSDT